MTSIFKTDKASLVPTTATGRGGFSQFSPIVERMASHSNKGDESEWLTTERSTFANFVFSDGKKVPSLIFRSGLAAFASLAAAVLNWVYRRHTCHKKSFQSSVSSYQFKNRTGRRRDYRRKCRVQSTEYRAKTKDKGRFVAAAAAALVLWQIYRARPIPTER